MRNQLTALILVIVLFSLALTSCKVPQPTATATATVAPATETPTSIVPLISQATATQPSVPTVEPTEAEELCDNTYIPSDDGTTWTYTGHNSKLGDYSRTDTILDSRDDGFTLGTTLPDTSYAVEFICSEAGLIDMDPMQTQLTAMLSGPDGKVSVTTTGISGITFPKDIQPANAWQHFVQWTATSADVSGPGEFIYNYTAMGPEVVTVPFGSFAAMRLDIEIDVEFGGPGGMKGTYNNTLWLVPDVGIVKSEGASHIPGVEFTDSIELVSFDSP